MKTFGRSRRHGFTLVELMIVVAVIGILAALAIFGVNKYLAMAKTSEAKNTVGAIARAAVAAYERESYGNTLLTAGGLGSAAVHGLCGASTLTPSTVPPGVKYQPDPAPGRDFNSGDSSSGWSCLAFSISQPIYYSYQYSRGAGINSAVSQAVDFAAEAQGDLNNNSTYSYFGRGGAIVGGQVVLSTVVGIQNEFE